MNKDVEKITTATTVTSRNRNKWKHSYENHLSSKSLCVLLHFCCCCCFMSSFMRWMNVASERAKTHFGPLNIPLHTFAVPDDVWVVWESPHTGIYFILNGLFFQSSLVRRLHLSSGWICDNRHAHIFSQTLTTPTRDLSVYVMHNFYLRNLSSILMLRARTIFHFRLIHIDLDARIRFLLFDAEHPLFNLNAKELKK